MRVLVVEDEADLANAIARGLRRERRPIHQHCPGDRDDLAAQARRSGRGPADRDRGRSRLPAACRTVKLPDWHAERLPEWMRSIRFRYTLMYSGVLFGLAALVVAALYLILSMTLHGELFGAAQTFCDEFGRCHQVDVFTGRQFE